MADTKEILGAHAKRRRDFIKSAGKFAVMAPAIAVLLADGVKPVQAKPVDSSTPDISQPPSTTPTLSSK